MEWQRVLLISAINFCLLAKAAWHAGQTAQYRILMWAAVAAHHGLSVAAAMVGWQGGVWCPHSYLLPPPRQASAASGQQPNPGEACEPRTGGRGCNWPTPAS